MQRFYTRPFRPEFLVQKGCVPTPQLQEPYSEALQAILQFKIAIRPRAGMLPLPTLPSESLSRKSGGRCLPRSRPLPLTRTLWSSQAKGLWGRPKYSRAGAHISSFFDFLWFNQTWSPTGSKIPGRRTFIGDWLRGVVTIPSFLKYNFQEREVGRGFRIGNTCTPMADSYWCIEKPIQYCKVKK